MFKSLRIYLLDNYVSQIRAIQVSGPTPVLEMALPLYSRCRGRNRCWGLMVKMMLLAFVIACIKPLRNALLYPVFPPLWRPIGTYKLLYIHMNDFFYPMDLKPYHGPCEDVVEKIQQLGILRKADELNATFRVYRAQDWEAAQNELRMRHDPETMRKLSYFSPALTEGEQRALLRALYVATSVLGAFNITYFVAEGTIIGALRHGGLIPWDDDADVLFKAEQWPVARRVLSCVPGFRLKIYSDFMWKFFSADSPLWQGEEVTRFPYVDMFPYAEDSEHVWPLVVWLKDIIMWPRHEVYPGQDVAFDNFWVRAPSDMAGIVSHNFGDIRKCASRLFERRERRLTTSNERISVDCKLLDGVYSFAKDYPYRVG